VAVLVRLVWEITDFPYIGRLKTVAASVAVGRPARPDCAVFAVVGFNP
jgi:hypothetical protein